VSPTQRALAECRKRGWTAQVVEKWVAPARRRIDLFGVIDLIVLDGQGGGPLGVQITSGQHHGERITKALEEPRLKLWMQSPARFEVWSFAKRSIKLGGPRKVWKLRRSAANPEAPHWGVEEINVRDLVPPT